MGSVLSQAALHLLYSWSNMFSSNAFTLSAWLFELLCYYLWNSLGHLVNLVVGLFRNYSINNNTRTPLSRNSPACWEIVIALIENKAGAWRRRLHTQHSEALMGEPSDRVLSCYDNLVSSHPICLSAQLRFFTKLCCSVNKYYHFAGIFVMFWVIHAVQLAFLAEKCSWSSRVWRPLS